MVTFIPYSYMKTSERFRNTQDEKKYKNLIETRIINIFKSCHGLKAAAMVMVATVAHGGGLARKCFAGPTKSYKV